MTYEFKYSISNSNGIFYYLFIFLGLFIAIFINYLILKFFNKPILLTLDKVIHGEYKHSVLAFLLLFIVPFIFLYGIFPCFIAGLMINKVMYKNGSIDILNNYAILHYKNEEIDLKPKELLVLKCLIQHKNQVLSREQILEEISKDVADLPCDRVVDVYIRTLRKKLALDCIVTVKNVGYKISL